jgi:uncharacterized protein YegL
MRRCTHITLILDKSDSMKSCHGATIEMVNTFINERCKDPDDCVMSLVQFSSHSMYSNLLTQSFTDTPIKKVPRLDYNNYRLNGMTALYDAMGRTIDDVGSRLASLCDDDRPDRVLVVVMTDGRENDSKHFSKHQIINKVSHQRDNYRWEFMFLGADMDSMTAELQAKDIGIHSQNTLNYLKASTRQAGEVMTQSVAAYAGPQGAAGPTGPNGPGIFALDPITKKMSDALRAEANDATSNTSKGDKRKPRSKK